MGKLLFSAAVALALWCASAIAASACKLVKTAEWQVRPQTGRLIVDGAINQQRIGILLDTGAQTSFVLRAAADRLGLTRTEAKGYRAFGVGGETYVEYAVIDELKIGTATRKNWRTLVLGERDPGRQYGFVLGYDFVDLVDLEFDLAHNALRIFRPQDCADVSLAYWAKGGASEATLEVDNEHPGILVAVKLNGKPLIAALDSGAPASVVSRLVAASVGIAPGGVGATPAGTSGGLGGGRPDQWIGAFESFSIGDEVIRNPNIRFTNLAVSTNRTGSRLAVQRELREMMLGVDFLRAHRVLVAHSQGKLYFTYTGGPVFDASPNSK
jgi:predicted aspartyl protease